MLFGMIYSLPYVIIMLIKIKKEGWIFRNEEVW